MICSEVFHSGEVVECAAKFCLQTVAESAGFKSLQECHDASLILMFFILFSVAEDGMILSELHGQFVDEVKYSAQFRYRNTRRYVYLLYITPPVNKYHMLGIH
jgi:hypothetical protein